VDYEKFLQAYNDFREDRYCNWWMAANLDGEPAPGPAGKKESFTVTGVPAGARYFAVRAPSTTRPAARPSATCLSPGRARPPSTP